MKVGCCTLPAGELFAGADATGLRAGSPGSFGEHPEMTSLRGPQPEGYRSLEQDATAAQAASADSKATRATTASGSAIRTLLPASMVLLRFSSNGRLALCNDFFMPCNFSI